MGALKVCMMPTVTNYAYPLLKKAQFVTALGIDEFAPFAVPMLGAFLGEGSTGNTPPGIFRIRHSRFAAVFTQKLLVTCFFLQFLTTLTQSHFGQ
jgi:hypothetical protein